MEKEKAVKVATERAEPLGISVGVASGDWQALMPKSASFARVGSALRCEGRWRAECRSARAEMTATAFAGRRFSSQIRQTAHAFVNCSFTKSQFIKFHQAAI